jgi:hypothetical protein
MAMEEPVESLAMEEPDIIKCSVSTWECIDHLSMPVLPLNGSEHAMEFIMFKV